MLANAAVLHFCATHTVEMRVNNHLDFLEGIFRLVKVLQREGHLVVQLSQPPVICLQHIVQNVRYRQSQ